MGQMISLSLEPRFIAAIWRPAKKLHGAPHAFDAKKHEILAQEAGTGGKGSGISVFWST